MSIGSLARAVLSRGLAPNLPELGLPRHSRDQAAAATARVEASSIRGIVVRGASALRSVLAKLEVLSTRKDVASPQLVLVLALSTVKVTSALRSLKCGL